VPPYGNLGLDDIMKVEPSKLKEWLRSLSDGEIIKVVKLNGASAFHAKEKNEIYILENFSEHKPETVEYTFVDEDLRKMNDELFTKMTSTKLKPAREEKD